MELNNIIVMKYGFHVQETVDDIMKRKTKEMQDLGQLFWGYGGSICNPITQVQPFLEENSRRGESTYLLLIRTSSDYHAVGSVAKFYSRDKVEWKKIPDGINVIGSKFALVCEDLTPMRFLLNLSQYKIAVGKSKNKLLKDYFRGRVDKACARKMVNDFCDDNNLVEVTWIAKVIDAVFVKGDK